MAMENANPFIRLGDDGENAPRLNYSVPESTNYVGTSVISINVDKNLLNESTIKVIRENVEKKKTKRPTGPIVNELRLQKAKIIPRSENVAYVNNKIEVKEIYDQYPSDFFYKPKESMLGFEGGFDISELFIKGLLKSAS